MYVAAFADFGGPDDIVIEQRDDPEPGAGEAVVDVDACSINRHDLWILEGRSPRVSADELPFVSGLDLAGTVASVGEDVRSVEPGDRVVLCPNETCGRCQFCRDGPENRCEQYGIYHGGLAEQALVRADRLVPLPEQVSMTAAAVLPTAYLTAWHMLRRAEARPGDLVFVPGGTGGVGVAAVQLVNVLGGSAIATSRSAEKLERVGELGADYLIRSDDHADLPDRVREIGYPDVVINHLGGPFTRAGLAVLDRGGRMVICGRTTGDISEIDVGNLFRNHQQVIGSTMGTQRDLERLVSLVADGQLQPVVGRTYELQETAQAFEDMLERDLFGKAIVQP